MRTNGHYVPFKAERIDKLAEEQGICIVTAGHRRRHEAIPPDLPLTLAALPRDGQDDFRHGEPMSRSRHR